MTGTFLDILFGVFKRTKKEALIKANKTISKRDKAEACQKELHGWLVENNGSIGIPVK